MINKQTLIQFVLFVLLAFLLIGAQFSVHPKGVLGIFERNTISEQQKLRNEKNNEGIRFLQLSYFLYKGGDNRTLRFLGITEDNSRILSMIDVFKDYKVVRDVENKTFCIHYVLENDSRGDFYKGTHNGKGFSNEPC